MPVASPFSGVDFSTGTYNSGASVYQAAKPTGLADHDTVLLVAYCQLAGSTFSSPPTGFTLVYKAAASSTRGFVLYAKFDVTAASEPSTYSLTPSSTTARGGIIAIRDPGIPALDAAPTSDAYNSTPGTSITAPAVTAVAAQVYEYLFSFSNNSTAVYQTFSATGFTDFCSLSQTNGSSTSVEDVQWRSTAGAGSTGTTAVGMSPSAATAGSFKVTFTQRAVIAGSATVAVTAGGATSPPAGAGTAAAAVTAAGSATTPSSGSGSAAVSITAAGNSPSVATAGNAAVQVTAGGSVVSQVSTMLAKNPFYGYWRGGGGDNTQDAAVTYAGSTTWNGDTSLCFLEASVWPTSDGYWMLSDLGTTGAVFDQNLTIASSTRAQLSALRTQAGSYPPMFLEDDILKVYGPGGSSPNAGPGWVLFLDNKGNANVATLKTLVESYGYSPNNLVAKSFGPSSGAWVTTMTAAGYQAWGYFYDADVGNGNVATYQSRYTLLGLNYDASTASWTAITSYGKPVIGHVVTTSAQASTARSQGAAGLMVGGVRAIVPPSAAGTASVAVTAAGAITPPTSAGTAEVSATAVGAGSARGQGTAAISVTAQGSGIASEVAGTAEITVTVTGSFRSPGAVGIGVVSITASGSTGGPAAPTAGNATISVSANGRSVEVVSAGIASVAASAFGAVTAWISGSVTVLVAASSTAIPGGGPRAITIAGSLEPDHWLGSIDPDRWQGELEPI